MFLCIKFLMRMEDGFLITPLKVKVSQSCLILCDPTDYNTVHGIFQARIL